jgi:hypothetical protein
VTLNQHPDFPSARCYVLKLHRDASPAAGALKGRLEHVASGEQFDFASAEALLHELLRHVARHAQPHAGLHHGPAIAHPAAQKAVSR